MGKKKETASAEPSHDYQSEDDARTLQRAHEVLTDEKRHGAAKKHLGKMQKHAKAAAGLKAAFPDAEENC